MTAEIIAYNAQLNLQDQEICRILAQYIDQELNQATRKIWHGHPVWFLNENPIVGYSKQKKGIRLLFWSGADFDEEQLTIRGSKFKDASIFFTDVSEVNIPDLQRWLAKGTSIQWDYKNLIKRKGKLERLK